MFVCAQLEVKPKPVNACGLIVIADSVDFQGVLRRDSVYHAFALVVINCYLNSCISSSRSYDLGRYKVICIEQVVACHLIDRWLSLRAIHPTDPSITCALC